jgi:hypothetical protein
MTSGFRSSLVRSYGRLTTSPSSTPWSPPAATDPYFANVTSLLHLNGTHGSTTITDVTGKTWTANGGSSIITSDSQFGGASLDVNGSGKYITSASHAGFGFGSGDYTVEGWNKYPSSSGNQCIFDNRSASDAGIGIYVANGSGGYLFVNSNTINLVTASSAFTANTWQHWAVVRVGTTVYIFIAGVLVGTGTDSRTLASAPAVYIGDNYLVPGGASQPAFALLDEFRITKGVGRYTATFTPPSAPFPDS